MQTTQYTYKKQYDNTQAIDNCLRAGLHVYMEV